MHRGLNEGNVKAEYTAWRKFHGHPVGGRATTADLAAMAQHFGEVPEYAAAVAKAKEEAAEAERKAQEKAAKAAEKAAAAAPAPAPAEPEVQAAE
jgi:sRNA-binding protein